MGRIGQSAISLAGLVIAVVSGVIFASPALEVVHGLSIDILTALRWQMFGARRRSRCRARRSWSRSTRRATGPRRSRARRPLTWTREIGRVLTAIVDGGAKVVGFDIVFPDLDRAVGDSVRRGAAGRARARLRPRFSARARRPASAAGKVVLGEVRARDQPIRPSPAQRIAVRQQQQHPRRSTSISIRDDVVRRLPLTFSVDGKPVPSMAVELASRALGAKPEFIDDGSV